MAKKLRPSLGRSPLPKQKGGVHKTPFDYDRRKWKKIGEDETAPQTPREDADRPEDTGHGDDTGRSDTADRSGDE